MKKWTVRKRDGVWVVLDGKGELRYAAAEYRMALAFATMRTKDAGSVFVFPHPTDYGSTWDEILRRMCWRRPDSDDE